MSQSYQRGSLRKVKRASGNDVWEWRYIQDGKRKQEMFRVADYPTAKAMWLHLQMSISVLNQGRNKQLLPGAVTIGQVADRYVKEHLPELSKSTRDTDGSMLKLHVKPHWDKVPVLSVKPMAVDAWLNVGLR